MALLYFPKSAYLGVRESFNPLYDQLTLATNPNMVFYFDSASAAVAASSSGLFITCSWSLSSSYATFVSNPGIIPYTTITTSSTNWITASFQYSEQYIALPTSALYNFTCSNVPSVNTASNVSLLIYNTAAGTSSLSFPSNWIFIGITPTSITASKSAILSLKSINNLVVAVWGQQY